METSFSSVVAKDTAASFITDFLRNSGVGLGFCCANARSTSTFSPTTLLTRSSNLNPGLRAVPSLAIATGYTVAMVECTSGLTVVELSANFIMVVTRSRITPLLTV